MKYRYQYCSSTQKLNKLITKLDLQVLPKLAIGPELELEEFVTEFPLVANVIAEVEVVAHCDKATEIMTNQ